MGDPASSSSELPVLDSSSSGTKWEEGLRKMLPAGAPLPDEEQLDYSISVDYQGPPPCFPSYVSSSSSNLNLKPMKFSSSYKTRRALLISRKNDILVERVYRDHVKIDKFESRNSEFSSVDSDFPAINCDDKFEAPVDSRYITDDDNCGDFSLNFCSESVNDVVESKTKVKVCSRCGKRRPFLIGEKRERCLVCGAQYCKNCVLKGMGSMPEGRKCVGCIGKPIDEANREKLGKCSRLLESVCSHSELRQIMKAEKDCVANQIRPEQVVVNGRPLKEEELKEILGCDNPPGNLRPGRYWYDENTGLWGQEGEKPDRFISAKLNLGAKLLCNASGGNTKVYINGRAITKLELRILKLANVPSIHNTHLWVYEDGSYEEEGQNNIKGNIWAKASTRLICSLFSLPVLRGNAGSPKHDPTTCSRKVMPESLEQGTVQKLLLLGSKGSGSSTIFKQAKFMYGYNFSAQELQDIKLIIQSNIYRYLTVLLEGQEHFEDEALVARKAHDLTAAEKSGQGDILLDGTTQSVYSIRERLKSFCDWLLEIVSMGKFDTFFPATARENAFILYEVWQDPAIQETYKRMKDLHFLPDIAKYFLDRALAMSSNEYQPSEEDILYSEGVTTRNGLAFFEFSSDEHSPMSEKYNDNLEVHSPSPTNYQLLHIKCKGCLNLCKWLEMFEDVGAVVFCASLSDYDQVEEHADGSISNKMLACRDLFESFVRHPTFQDTPFVLLLNKSDTFEEKIDSVPLTACDWFWDFSPMGLRRQRHSSLADQAYHYIAVKFKVLYSSITGKKLFVWRTRARDRSSANEAFKYVFEVVKWEQRSRNLQRLYEDDEFDSLERTCSPCLPQDLTQIR